MIKLHFPTPNLCPFFGNKTTVILPRFPRSKMPRDSSRFLSDSGSATARYVVGIERQGDAGGDGMGRELIHR